jgi:hypothetical protein
MKVVFLDIDGVLIPVPSSDYRTPSAECVARLNEITNESGAVIVVSSTWRKFPNIADTLKGWGVKAEVVGITPDLSCFAGVIWISPERGREITAWLHNNPEVESYVVLDDGTDMETIPQGRHVRTMTSVGLTKRDVERATRTLTLTVTKTICYL